MAGPSFKRCYLFDASRGDGIHQPCRNLIVPAWGDHRSAVVVRHDANLQLVALVGRAVARGRGARRRRVLVEEPSDDARGSVVGAEQQGAEAFL
jgi:hypothetical protein